MGNRLFARTCSFVLLFAGVASLSTAAGAGEPRVSGLNQLVVLQPDAHERGLPAVQLKSDGNGALEVDIPATVHVHRFYYDGDKEYQGPILQGGPTVVVANHPKTGDRKYVDVTLPAGAPVIAYCKSAITYIYPDRRVSICFSSWNPEKMTVKYHSGQGGLRKAGQTVAGMHEKTKEAWSRSPTVQSLADATRGGGELLVGAKNSVDSATAGVLDKIRSLGAMIPGVSTLRGAAADNAAQGYQAHVRGFQRAADVSAPAFVETNR